MNTGPRIRFALAFLVTGFVLASCSENDTVTDPGPDPVNPTISLTLSPTSASVAQGSSITFDGVATLGGDFTGAPSFSVTGQPTGVTATVGSVDVSGTTATATVTISADGSVAPGSYTATVTATGSGVSDTATFTLEVTAAASYALAATPGTISIDRGSSGDVTIDLTRTNFTDAVTLAAEGVPAGVTATFDPAAPTGATSTLTLAVGPSATETTTTITVRGTTAGLSDVTTTFDMTITIPVVPDLTIDFAQCSAEDQPIWAATADGVGQPWSTVSGVNDTYAVTGRTQNDLGLALAYDRGSETEVSILYFDATGLSGQVDVCANDGTKTVTGSVTGINGFATVSLGAEWATAFPGQQFQLTDVPDGPLPLVAYAMSDPVTGAGDMLIRRDQNIPNNGSVGTLDFTTEAFTPASATISISNIGQDQGFAEMGYAAPLAGDLCSYASLYQVEAGPTFTGYSAPVAEQQAGELHVVDVIVAGSTTTREVSHAFATLADRTVTLPSELPSPTLSDVTGSAQYLRLEAELTIPSEYDHTVTFGYSTSTESAFISYQGGLLSGAVTLTIPDLSGLAGWDDAWAPAAAASNVEYLVGAGSEEEDVLETNPYYCTDGGRYVFGTYTGVYN